MTQKRDNIKVSLDDTKGGDILLNKKKLKAVIQEYDGNQANLANAMGLSLSQLSLRINGHMEFSVVEAAFIRDRYSLSDEDVLNIFFAEKVS